MAHCNWKTFKIAIYKEMLHEIYKFTKESGKLITQFDSNFKMTRIGMLEKTAHIGYIYLEKNGIIGNHQAVTPQLLLIISGEGFEKGNDNTFNEVSTGDAVFWDKGEWH
ncbi:cupin [Terribacillus sp. JSM ZJ617]|uniref:cupin n=1 Tax=Terribacillus sp. JSM ZJ617 TaxID=3342119 RepID=UPI0035A84EAB